MGAPVVAGFALLAAVGWPMLDGVGRENVSAVSRASVRAAGSAFYELMQRSAEEMGGILGTLSRDGELTAAVAARDHRRLLAKAAPTYYELRARHGITHWNYWEVEGPGAVGGPLRNLVRLGAPSMRGDLVERATLSRVSREKALVTGLDLGYTGFALRALAPLRQGDRLIGYVELGREIGSFLGEMKRRTGDDYALVLDKRFVDPRRWASARGALGERNDWADLADVLLVRDTIHGTAALERLVLPQEIPDEGTALEVRREGSRVLARGAFPVQDASGRKVGAVLVVRDVTSLADDVERVRRAAAKRFGALMIALALAIGVAFEVLVIRPQRRAQGAP